MFGLTSFDTARAAMDQSSYRMGFQDRQSAIATAAELVNFYQGNQRAYLEQHIEATFRETKLQELYKRLIFFANITSLIVDRVTILGKRRAEIKFLNDDGTPNEEDQKLWDRVSKKELGHGGFNAFLAALGKYKELCKTVVALPFWDPRADRLRLRFYTPNLIDVAWDLEVGDPLTPTAYRILLNDQQNRFRVFDFSDPFKGVMYEAIGEGDVMRQLPTMDGAGRTVKDVALPAVDPNSGETLNPFVPFRTALPLYSYFIDDGQEQMLEGQRTINRLWTQEMGIMHHGAFQVPILEGPAWTRVEAGPIQLTYDPSQGIAVPSNPGDAVPSTIRWGGPANEGFIQAHLDVTARVAETLVSTFHISANEVIAKANPASGVSLFIGNSALKEKQEADSILDEASLEELAWKIVVVWNAHAPEEKGRFSLKGEISAKVPMQPMNLDPKDEVGLDALKCEEGFIDREDVVKKYNPGATPEKIAKIMAQKQPVAPPTTNSLFRSAAQPANAQKTPVVPTPPARGGAMKPAGMKPGKNTGQ